MHYIIHIIILNKKQPVLWHSEEPKKFSFWKDLEALPENERYSIWATGENWRKK